MNILDTTLLIGLGSLAAGFLGALTGLGGGIIITPLLTLVLGVDIHYAIGASLVAVLATSSGAAAAYVKKGFTNIRIAMFLEIATTFGALIGASVSAWLSTSVISIIFGIVLLLCTYATIRPTPLPVADRGPDRLARFFKMDSTYPTKNGEESYHVHHIPTGFTLMFFAGGLSGLLGIGGGAMKVLAMDQAMRIPFKVSTTTSNFMIGVTAAASAGVYLQRGYIDPGLAMPVILGVLLGAFLGARVLVHTHTTTLRKIFGIVIAILAFEMMYHGITGKL